MSAPANSLLAAAKAHLAAREALENVSVNNLEPTDARFAAVLATLETLRNAVAASEEV